MRLPRVMRCSRKRGGWGVRCALREARANDRWKNRRSRWCKPIEHGGCVTRYLHAAPFGNEDAVGVDQERTADHAHVALAVQHLLAEHAERVAPGFVAVRNQRERQFLLRAEFAVRGGRVT